MTGTTGDSQHWLNEALFAVDDAVSSKTPVDADLAQDEVLRRIAGLTDLQKLSLVELIGTRGPEHFLKCGRDVTGTDISAGLAYLFSSSIRDMILGVTRATDGSEVRCHYCVEPVDPESEDACKQATLWVSGPKSQNTRLRTYTGARAHKLCVEKKAKKSDTSEQETLEF